MTLAPDLLGSTGEPVTITWTPEEVMLYALAVGAGQEDPTRGLAYTSENTDGSPLRVLPTYANILCRGAGIDLGDIHHTQLVHAEQSFRVLRPLPVEGSATVSARVTDVLDKGRAAMVSTQFAAVDDATGDELASTTQTVFIGGEGGFGGPRGESVPSLVPDREPDETATVRTRPEQALLYRLTGDRNPLHSDPAFAAQGGFDRPILHGMCTYGFTGRVLLDRLCDGDPARFAGMAARFTKPVLPGDELTVALWHAGDADPAHAYFRTLRGEDVVLDRGVLDLAG